jgi:Do/DeqQ family serine protease
MIIRVLTALLVLSTSISAHAEAQAVAVPQSQEQMKLSFSPVVKKTAPAVVNIYTKRTVSKREAHPFALDPFFAPFFRNDVFGGRMRQQVESSLGSGVIVEADGLVVTNAHVVRGADEITVALDNGREFPATLSLKDDASDLALLRIDTGGESLPHVTLKSSETLEVGDIVLAIGNPFGVGQTVTSGIVSAQGRSSLNINDFNFFIQTDAAINPGNSGGALVALDGGVVGINTAIYSRDGGSLGIGFAIPAEMVKSIIAAEKSGQTIESTGGRDILRPWLGVTSQNVSSDIAESLGLEKTQGSIITALSGASPLKKVGVRVGDLIFAVNEKPVLNAQEVKFRMATVPLGKQAKFDIIRPEADGSPRKFSVFVKAVAPPDDPPRNTTTLKGAHVLNGATIANINPAIAVELGIKEEQGVIVTNVARSQAMRVVSKGDILVEVNDEKIEDVKDAVKALSKAGQTGISLVIKSGGRLQRIVIR